MIAPPKHLNKPCEVDKFSGNTVEDLKEAYIDSLEVIGKCEQQRKKLNEYYEKEKENYDVE